MNKTVLSDEEIRKIADAFFTKDDDQDEGLCFARDIEQALLQSPEIRQALADTKRLDFLADKNQTVANVLLPIDVVMNNMGDMRAAIDEVMEAKP